MSLPIIPKVRSGLISLVLVAFVLRATGVIAAELPPPLAIALSQLSARDRYSWTTTTEAADAPFSVAPVTGRYGADGIMLLESTVDKKSLQVVRQGERRAVNIGTVWETPTAMRPPKGSLGTELARLLVLRPPAEELPALLAAAGPPKATVEGTFTAELNATVAREMILSTVKGRAPGGFTPEIKNAMASLRVELGEGAVRRYAITVSASLSLPFGTKEIRIVTTVALLNPAPADFTVPEAALALLKPATKP